MQRPLIVAGIAALGLLALAPVQAQQLAQAQSTARPAPQKAAPQKAPQAQAQPAPGAAPNVEEQVADLRKQLNVTAAQQPQFDALASAIRQNAQDMSANMPPPGQNAALNAVEGMRMAQKLAQSEADSLNRLLPPLQALYDTLSPDQKKVADQLFSEQDSGPPPPQPQQAPKRR